jgi:heme exporter protein D
MDAHSGFIVAAYAATAIVIAALILRAVLDHRAQTRALAELESRGIGRRSTRARNPEPDGRPDHG